MDNMDLAATNVTVPLDENAWRAWVAKNHKSEQLGIAKRRMIARRIGTALVAVGILWLWWRPF